MDDIETVFDLQLRGWGAQLAGAPCGMNDLLVIANPGLYVKTEGARVQQDQQQEKQVQA